MKRKEFLDVFLKALGAKHIQWGNSNKNKIFGTVIYDTADADERQDFVWYMTEEKVPSEDVKKLISYLSTNNLIDIDKITKPITAVDLSFIDPSKKQAVLEELYSIRVNMLDEGIETDVFFIHG